MSLTSKEINLQEAEVWFRNVDLQSNDFAAEAEAAYLLKTKFRMSRDEIAAFLELTLRQVMTRLHSYKLYVEQGLIPTGRIPQFAGAPETPRETVLLDEDERLKRLSIGRETRSALRDDLFLDRLVTAVSSALPDAATLKAVETLHKSAKAPRVGPKEEEVAMTAFSDLHLHLTTSTHDYKRGLAANDNYLRKVVRLTDFHRQNFIVRKIVMNFLGDNMQGGANYSNQRWDVDMAPIKQAESLAEMIVRDIELAMIEFDEVEVVFERGNHGYVFSKKTTTEPDYTNWETVVAKMVMMAFRSTPRVKFNYSDDWYQIIDVKGSRFLMTHGHAMMGSGTFDGVVKTIKDWGAVVPAFDYAMIGHFHRCASLPIPTPLGQRQRTVYMNGTAVDHDDFLQKMGGSPTPQWWLLFVNEKGVTAEHKVRLYD